jgi:PAS domain S-box-containing protein
VTLHRVRAGKVCVRSGLRANGAPRIAERRLRARLREVDGMTPPTGRERIFDENEIIVSKTDPNGRITYANDVFLRVSGYSEAEIIGKPHSLIRHPDMPRCVFDLLWRTIAGGREIFAYVINQAKGGDHYWVLAHVTPTFGRDGSIVGYHSNRRTPDRRALDGTIRPLYEALLEIERGAPTKAEQIARSRQRLEQTLAGLGKSYEAFLFSLHEDH